MSKCECGAEMETQEVCEQCGNRRALPPVRVEALVRKRYGVKKGMGQFWVNDSTESRFMALCPRGRDARAICKALNAQQLPNNSVRVDE
jgi:hypothetical protein